MPNTSYPLTRNAQVALNNARRIAEQNQQPSIDSLALLLALLQLPKSQVFAVLTSLKVKVENLAARVSATINTSTSSVQGLEAGQAVAGPEGKGSGLNLAVENESILSESLVEMKNHALDAIDGHILLLGLLQ